jgi:hypothetical protein
LIFKHVNDVNTLNVMLLSRALASNIPSGACRFATNLVSPKSTTFGFVSWLHSLWAKNVSGPWLALFSKILNEEKAASQFAVAAPLAISRGVQGRSQRHIFGRFTQGCGFANDGTGRLDGVARKGTLIH